jgi:hypothetical protein
LFLDEVRLWNKNDKDEKGYIEIKQVDDTVLTLEHVSLLEEE